MAVAQDVHTNEPTSEMSEALTEGDLLLGDQFTILSRLGSGGFGITYLAKDNYLDRKVVIKECFPEVFCCRTGTSVHVRSTSNLEKFRSIVSMFAREARSIAKLRHPNIIGVHRVFEDNETAYIALELVDGHNLLEIIESKSGGLPAEQVKDILIQLLDAVQVVHEQDLLHRDISPDNILLDKAGKPVLIDFGAAREEASRETRALSMVLVVKDGYSPHEFYFAGGKQTPSSDLYALAATFYHLITGKAPPNSQIRMADVAAGNPDPCTPLVGRFNTYDDTFLKAIDKAMSVLPKDRLQSAEEWRAIIDANEAQKKPFGLPPIDQTLEKTLIRLVSETNEQLQKTEAQANAAEGSSGGRPRLAVPQWVRDFNEETVQRKSISHSVSSYVRREDALKRKYDSHTGRVTVKSIVRVTGYLTVAALFAIVSYTTVFAG